MSSFRSGTTARTFASCHCGGGQSSAAPTGLNKCTITNNPGLAPWALKKYRPLGALLHPTPIHLFYLMRLPSHTAKPKDKKLSVGYKQQPTDIFILLPLGQDKKHTTL